MDSKSSVTPVIFSGQITRLGLEPLADVPGAPLTVRRPLCRKAVAHDVVGFDAERVADDLGGLFGVVAVDRLWRRLVMGGRLTEFRG